MNFNEDIIKLWADNLGVLREWYGDREVLAPMLYPPLHQNALLTVGINPSFSEDRISELQGEQTDRDVWNHYIYKNLNNNSQSWIDYEKTAREKYRYYCRFRTVKKYLNVNWNHIDLYYIRDTEQKEFLKKLKKYPELKKKQINLTKAIITSLKPSIILVANARGVSEYKTFYKKDLDWSDETGCYSTNIDGNKVPTHFSGQLTYMDKESLKRLKWVMKKSI